MKRAIIIGSLLLLVVLITAQQYRSLEMRIVSHNPKANGETDFKGKTEIFDTEQRMQYLRNYANVATKFFNDPDLNKQPVSVEMAKKVVKQIKPQPLPVVRNKVLINDWKFVGYSEAKAEREKANLNY